MGNRIKQHSTEKVCWINNGLMYLDEFVSSRLRSNAEFLEEWIGSLAWMGSWKLVG